jgi:iron complex transport system permease protein
VTLDAASARAAGPALTRLTARSLGGLLVVLLLVSVAANLAAGAVRIPPERLPGLIAGLLGLTPIGEEDRVSAMVLAAIRLPRILLGVAVGAALGVAGAAMQGLFRNPLAEPSLLGVSSGGALFAAGYIVIGASLVGPLSQSLAVAGLPLAAFAGAMLATVVVLAVRRFDPAGGVLFLLLGGIAVNALAGAGIGLLTFVSNDQQLRTLVFWTLGSLGSSTPMSLFPAVAAALLASVLLMRLARPLDLLALGEEAASHAGVDVRRVEREVAVLVAVAVGAAVSVTGLIGFVGLVVPHLVRLVIGPSQRNVLPCAALAGAALLTLADLVARTVVIPAELPIGIVTALVGAPVFLWLLARTRTREGLR